MGEEKGEGRVADGWDDVKYGYQVEWNVGEASRAVPFVSLEGITRIGSVIMNVVRDAGERPRVSQTRSSRRLVDSVCHSTRCWAVQSVESTLLDETDCRRVEQVAELST